MTTLLRVLNWNIGGGYTWNSVKKSYCDYDLEYVVEKITHYAPDIVCLQEVQGSACGQFAMIEAALGLRGTFQAISKSHFRSECDLGLAIYSKWQSSGSAYHPLPNPRIEAIDEDGVPIVSFDNGFLRVTLDTEPPVNVLCGHNLPVHRFHREFMDDQFRPVRETLRGIVEQYAETQAIICADMNYENVSQLIPCLKTLSFRDCLPERDTTPTGKRVDYIFVTRTIEMADAVVDTSAQTDHFPCLAVVVLPDTTLADHNV